MLTPNSRDPISREAVRQVDERAITELGMPGIVLLENAARGCVDWLVELKVSGPISICAGKGNNGGDGFVIARHLENLGHDVQVLLFANPDQLVGDAATNFEIIKNAGSRIIETHHASPREIAEHLSAAAWIIDGLLGTGTRGSLREPFLSAIPIINQAKGKRFAIDLPSGMDCDSGQPVDGVENCVRADFTATFVAPKLGFDTQAATPLLGEVRVIDIGVPRAFLNELLTEPSNKTDRDPS
jgi:NAD(P)H-hydrate epimerase